MNYSNNTNRKYPVAALGMGCLLMVQTSTIHAATLEEVVVTAQKREQNMQDVPVAIQAVLGEDMRASGIEKMEVLAPTIPSLHVSEAFGGDQIFLRGLGPGVNFGFEQAVGQVVDGFFYGRSRFSRLQFLDLERVEILKGPQGAIIGKNTTAGAINITTANPTDEFEAWATISQEIEGAEGETYEGAISGPLTDSIKARLALRFEDKDGFLDNKTTGKNDQSRNDLAGRVKVMFEPSDNFSAMLQYGFSDIERDGRNIQPIHCSAVMRATIASLGINEDCKLNDTRSTIDTHQGVGGFEFQDTEASTMGMTLAWAFDAFTITSLSGYAEYEYTDGGFGSYTGIENFAIDITEDYKQFSQEIRMVSNGGEKVDYIVGIFYQDQSLDSDFDLNIGSLGPNTFNRNRRIQTDQESDTIALFGQVSWHLTEQWDVTFEGRYTREEKDGHSVQFPAALYGKDPVPGPGSGGPAGVFNVHDVKDDLSENDFSPGLVLQWMPTDNAMYYASIKKGFKGGGFDHQLTANQEDASDGRFSFGDEQVISTELGGKLTIADGAARLNFSIFRNEYDELQVSSQISTATFAVGNAASAITQGVETELEWRVTDALTVTAAVALLDAEFDEFPGGPCSQYQIANAMCPDGTQDLSNQTLPYAPDYSFNGTVEYVVPLSDNFELIGFLRAYGEDEKQLALDMDPNTVQDSFTKVDARITLADTVGRWQVSVIGRNLGDETTISFANDITLFNGSYFGVTEAPRSIILQGTLRF